MVIQVTYRRDKRMASCAALSASSGEPHSRPTSTIFLLLLNRRAHNLMQKDPTQLALRLGSGVSRKVR
jgi:hypothetical protein